MGCGEDGEGEARDEVIAAADRTLATGSAVIESTVDDDGDKYRIVQRADFEADRAIGTFKLPSEPGEADGPIRQYIDGPRGFFRDPASGDWYEQQKSAIDEVRDSPSNLLALLDEALVDVRESTEVPPGGLRRFDGGYDVGAIFEKAGEEPPEELNGRTTPASIYVNEEGLISRIDLDIGGVEEDPSTTLTTTIELKRFGADPRIGEPPDPVGIVPTDSGP